MEKIASKLEALNTKYKLYNEVNVLAINGDCLDIIPTLEKVDCILTDPPYNIARKTNFKTIGKRAGNVAMQFGDWDKDADILSYIDFLSNVLKENSNVVIFNDWKNLGDIYKRCLDSNILMKRYLVLNKSNPAPFNRDRMFVNDVEFAVWGVFNSKNVPTGWTFNRENSLEKCVIDTTIQNSKFHPTMKDIKIIRKLTRLLTNNNDIVLDCFGGSGTTAIACIKENRRCIIIEKDQEYFDIMCKRIEDTIIDKESQLL